MREQLCLRPCNRHKHLTSGGGGEIRTLGGLSPSLVFKTSAFNRSATPPRYGGESYYNPRHSQLDIPLFHLCPKSVDFRWVPRIILLLS